MLGNRDGNSASGLNCPWEQALGWREAMASSRRTLAGSGGRQAPLILRKPSPSRHSHLNSGGNGACGPTMPGWRPLPRKPRGGQASGGDAAVPSPSVPAPGVGSGHREAEGDRSPTVWRAQGGDGGSRREAGRGPRSAYPPRTPADAGTRVTGASSLRDTPLA